MGRRALLPVLLLLFCFKAGAQELALPATNQRFLKVAVHGDTLRIDTLSIAVGSLSVVEAGADDYNAFPAEGFLVWKKKPALDSITLRYRALPLSLTRPYFHKDKALLDSQFALFEYHVPDANATGAFVDYSQLDYNGSIGRSISLGNNQDVALNSNLNLQANGYILDSIKLEAAITDNTVPFQPEGNTQRLQEFDQVFIHLQKNQHNLQLGDYNLERPKGYFLNYFKRVQGILYQDHISLSRNSWDAFGLSASVAKGQFARNIFQGLEGNQGPYKLTGNNGEQFFIVLAGTERVFINGVQMQRGEQADYIINYNTAEIRFMPRRLITKDSRIQVEFEYQDRSYLNSLIYGYNEVQLGKKWNLRLNVYANQDAKNQNYTQSLTGEQKRFLGAIGDSIQNALYPVIVQDTFSASKILYKVIDTTIGALSYDSVFVYSTNPDSARYSLSFSFVGEGRADYIISPSNANGRVYEWVAPVNGKPQGNYSPVQLLITPKALQVVTAAATYQIDSLKTFFVEGALSNYDPNTFSKVDNQSHAGLAIKLRYNESRLLGMRDSLRRSRLVWANELNYEYVQDRFRAVAPYRNVEFGRDWNVPQNTTTAQQSYKPDEHLAGYVSKLDDQKLGALGYSLTYYKRGAFYDGYRNVLSYQYNKHGFNNGFVLNQTNTKDTAQNGRYFRPTVFAEYQLKKLARTAIGARFEEERNELRDAASDTLRRASFAFQTLTAYVRTPDEQPVHYSIAATQRQDYIGASNALRQQDYSRTLDARIGIAKWTNQSISLTGSYRKLYITDSTITALKPEQTLLGRLEYNGSALKNVFQIQSLYELGSGQEQKREFTYLEVPAGQGLYTWNDYNGDGVQQSNEFELAIYPDQKKFIRILTLTNEYVRVNYVTYNQSLYIEPSNYFAGKPRHAWQKLLTKTSDQASLQISNRLLSSAGNAAFNPFLSTLADDNVILTGNTLNNTFYFNRNNAKAGFDYNYLRASTKQLLTYGVEGSRSTQHLPRLRFNIGPSFTANISGRAGTRSYKSALADGRTYHIDSRGGEPSLTWLYRAAFRATGSFRYEARANEKQYGGESANVATANLELRYTQPLTGAITLRGTYTGITYKGMTSTPVAFAILDALQPGANLLWYANWERRVSKGIEIAVEYEGRQAGKNPVVHTGRMTLRAIL